MEGVKNSKYIGIKVIGLDHYLWFEIEKINESEGKFVGLDGWGHRGSHTHIDVEVGDITSKIHSDTLQYQTN